jgi:hypothetical protein
MTTIFNILFLLLILTSCTKTQYRYEIKGKVYVPTSGLNPLHDATWYADSIHFDGDTICYRNSNRKEVRIKPPYTLIDHKLDE